ncbi:MAG TPA: FtsK/SpoIIIE domain-containing protein, partial [Aquihabitans sp.]|nr:FtsK/SpoIIIE domain-containing protein [Aquihabitans sp.]
MRIRHGDPPHHRDLVVEVDDPDATVADLGEALEPHRPAGPLLVDGRRVPAATPLDRAGIADGAVVARPTTGAGLPIDPKAGATGPALLAVTTTGPDAGRRVRLAPGPHVVGRAGAATGLDVAVGDPTVSARHARLVVDDDLVVHVTDVGSTNGTWLGTEAVTSTTTWTPGVALRLGATQLLLDPAPGGPSDHSDRPPGAPAGGARPLHRPPRRLPPEEPPPVRVPDAPEPPPAVTPVGVAAVLASLAVGGTMVLVLGSWTYALFSLLGPVLVVAGALDSRRRRRRARRRGSRWRRAELARFAEAVAERATHQVAALDARYAGVHRSRATATGPAAGCWERRPTHPDAYDVRVGVGAAPWCPPTTAADAAPDVAAILDRHRTLADAPIGLRLEAGRAVAIVGPAAAAHGLLRSIVVQASVAHGPADLRMALLAEPGRAATWDWCAWLPHARTAELGSLLAGTERSASRLAASLVPPSVDRHAGAGDPPTRTLVVVDDPPALAARRSAARTVLRAAADPDAGIAALVLVDDPRAVPAACTTVLTVAADGTLTGPADLVVGPATAAGTSVEVATDVARALARWDDPEVDDAGRGLPGAVRLASLLGADRLTPDGLRARWRSAGADPPPRAVLGVAADGPLVVDLATDGPHALVAGTTGSGKSELLRTLVASLAAGSSPDHLTFVLIDFKGGSAFDACARLPHTTGLVTDLDDHLAARALRCLDAELRHREQRLRSAGAPDLAALRRLVHEPPLPRLVVVVDEFATLAAELPDFVDALVGVAQRGRSLGVHLVLATQRPSGSVSESIRANTALRIALRVQSPADSADVIDVPDAARLGRAHPGRALVRLGPGELAAVQVAHASAPGRSPGSGGRPPAAVRVRPLAIASETAGDDDGRAD